MKWGVVAMSPERLLKHFEQISEAPDAVPRLRRFILDLAVRGKLVEQDPADEPAAALLKHVEKADMPFEIPPTWISAKAGQLLNMQYGKALPASDRSDHGSVPVFGSNGVVGYCEAALSQEPAIIIGRKGSAGALNLCDGPSWTTDVAYFLVPSPFFNIRFLLVVLKTLDLGSLGKGVKPGLNRAEAYQLSVVVPPIAEQYRIVAKVDELMALCDELEAAQFKRERRRDRLVAATLHGLNNGSASTESGDGLSFAENAQFYFDHLPRLTTRAEHIQQLRQTILNLAVSGKLVPQDAGDEPVAVLQKRLTAEVKSYASQARIASASPEPVTKDAIPWPAPPGWIWTRLSSLCKVITDGDHQPPPKTEEGVAFLTIGNITTGRLIFSNCRFVSQEYYDSLATYRKPSCGDILYTVVGATYGRPAMVETDRSFCVQRHIAILKPISELNASFLCLLLASPFVYEQATRSTTGTAQPTVPLKPLRNFLVPLPPLAEQNRIVAKVEELMSLCDNLDGSLTSTTKDRSRLLDATLQEALSQ